MRASELSMLGAKRKWMLMTWQRGEWNKMFTDELAAWKTKQNYDMRSETKITPPKPCHRNGSMGSQTEFPLDELATWGVKHKCVLMSCQCEVPNENGCWWPGNVGSQIKCLLMNWQHEEPNKITAYSARRQTKIPEKLATLANQKDCWWSGNVGSQIEIACWWTGNVRRQTKVAADKLAKWLAKENDFWSAGEARSQTKMPADELAMWGAKRKWPLINWQREQPGKMPADELATRGAKLICLLMSWQSEEPSIMTASEQKPNKRPQMMWAAKLKLPLTELGIWGGKQNCLMGNWPLMLPARQQVWTVLNIPWPKGRVNTSLVSSGPLV